MDTFLNRSNESGSVIPSFVNGTISPLPYSNTSLSSLPPSTTVVADDETTICLNAYCISEDDYVEMLVNYIFPTSLEWVLIGFYMLVCTTGVTGNLLVCLAVWRNHSMRTVTNMFIVNLAVADFLVCLICLPPTVLDDVTETWYMGQIMCKIVKYVQVCREIQLTFFNILIN